MDRTTKIAVVFLSLFALPFCGLGLGAFFSGLRRVASGGAKEAWMLVLFGFAFSAVGFGLLLAAILGPKKIKQANRRQAENPGQPWLWREDWAQGRADTQNKSSLIGAWIFAVMWNLISAPTVFLVPRAQFLRDPKMLLILLFPVVGVGLLIRALRQTVRWTEFGQTYFEMTSIPCVVGRDFQGTIQARFPHSPDHGVQLKLSCVNRVVSGAGDNRTTNDRILWCEEKTVSPGELCPGPTGTRILVAFRIPVDARPTDASNASNSILWRLEAHADVPGVDYQDAFELPVFRTKDTPTAEEYEQSKASEPALGPRANPTVRVGPAAQGGTEFCFPPARNKGAAGGLTVFCLVWTGAIWLQIVLRAPFIFPLVTGLIDLFLIYSVLQMWAGTSIVVIRSGALSVRTGFLGGGRTQEIPCAQISAVQGAISAQQGGTAYYDIQITLLNRRKITLGKMIRDKQEVDWLVASLKQLIGLQAQKAQAAAAR
jgi:hypothetical protein